MTMPTFDEFCNEGFLFLPAWEDGDFKYSQQVVYASSVEPVKAYSMKAAKVSYIRNGVGVNDVNNRHFQSITRADGVRQLYPVEVRSREVRAGDWISVRDSNGMMAKVTKTDGYRARRSDSCPPTRSTLDQLWVLRERPSK